MAEGSGVRRYGQRLSRSVRSPSRGTRRINRSRPASGDAVRVVQGRLRPDDMESPGSGFRAVGIWNWTDVLNRGSGLGARELLQHGSRVPDPESRVGFIA